jgi:hypothetical protein
MDITHEYKWRKGKYKDVAFNIVYSEIVKYRNKELNWWTYYIYIELDKLPDRVKPKTFWLELKTTKNEYGVFHYYPYLKHQILSEIYFYNPMTEYSKTSGFEEPQPKIIGIGCDCGSRSNLHIFDIKDQVKLTIDSFYDLIPEYGN